MLKRTIWWPVFLLLISCSDDSQPAVDGPPGQIDASAGPDLKQVDLKLTMANYPAVDGSTSAHPLGMLVACKLLGMPYTWGKHPYDGTKRLLPDPKTAQEKTLAAAIQMKVVHNGTHSAYINLIGKKADLILVARLPSQDELDEAKKQSVTLSTRAVAMDAFVFIVNKQNPVQSLTIKQIQEIYTGKLTRWDQVGGKQEKINPYQRNKTSGSQQLMLSLVMKGLTMINAPNMILESMMGPINRISQDPLGLGYSVYFFEQFMAPNEKLKLLGVGGTVPDSKTIRTRTYPYATRVYAVTRADQAAGTPAARMMQWLQTVGGQTVVKESGYVPFVE